MPSALELARDAFAERAWRAAYDAYAVALAEAGLSAEDHERRAVAAYLVGDDDTSERAWSDAHRSAADAGDACAAARYAFWLGFCLLLGGRAARAAGWFSRAKRVVDDAAPHECAASAYLAIPQMLGVLGDDPTAARDLALHAVEVGARLDDGDLRALGILGHGQALIAMGEVEGGVACLDEVMVTVTAGEVGPITTGIVYCAVILECMSLFDLARASEWTDALGSWCDAQPGLVPFRGQCLVHRSQLQTAAGEWRLAIATVEGRRPPPPPPPHPALGLAHYQAGELHRLAGSFAAAEAAYREASRRGQDPMPGLALLDLARGDASAAAAAIRRALGEAPTTAARAVLLAAAAHILREAGDIAAARMAADELGLIATKSTAQPLKAMSAYSSGSVLLAEGQHAEALVHLRVAGRTFRQLHMPYEAARTALLVGLACDGLGDGAAAQLEFANAREGLAALGAMPDLERVDALTGTDAHPDGLSDREREVLGHLAAGRTNSEIAAALVISRHTVRRHVEHIFAKLGVSTRAAATAYAYEHGLRGRDG